VLALGAGAIAAAAYPRHAFAADEYETHGLSVFGDLKYPADFRHFEYVDPQAPKGGSFSQIGPARAFNQSFLTFNSLNSYILKGDAAQGMELTFAPLMVRASDEPDAMYGLIARSVRVSADGRTYRFSLRPEARFQDGTPLTAHDVAFSLAILREKGHPIITQLLRDFEGAEALDDASAVVRFSANRARDLPLFVAGLPIFSRGYYANRPFDETTLEPPLGSGPYQVARFEPGRFIEYQRVRDWWGAALPVAVGQYNFDSVRFEYYRDREVGFEGFSGKSYLFREEFTSRTWATRYDFPAVRDGRVKRDVIRDDTPSRAAQRPARARGAHVRVRFRMDQQEHHVRIVRAHPFGVPEFRHDGARAAGGRRTRPARAVPRPSAGRGVRGPVGAARFGRLRPGPRAPAQGDPAAAGRRLDDS
jgi:microcin C transport system substrate-binding protein